MDAASIMGKTKSLQDKLDALTRENARLRGEAPGASPVRNGAAETNQAARSFGRGSGTQPNESQLATDKKLKLKTADTSGSSSSRGDNKNKFAKSLFGSVRGTKAGK